MPTTKSAKGIVLKGDKVINMAQLDSKCKICRRLGVKLFLKGDRCLSQKCAMVKRAYPPGKKGKRRPKTLSEYGRELREKQKLRNWYNLRERQFRRCVKEILDTHQKRGSGTAEDAPTLLIRAFESRLDNVIFRLGIAASRAQARQFISHGHFLVNGKKVKSPGYILKKGDKIGISSSGRKKSIFQGLPALLKNKQLPSWLSFSGETLEGKITGQPSLEEASPPAEISLIFEYYSK